MFFLFKLKLASPEYLFFDPTDALIIPLNPLSIPFFKIILMIPAPPSALYLTEGFVITSIRLIALAGVCFSTSLELNVVGFPLINTLKSELPRSFTFPSASVWTEGDSFKASAAVPPIAVRLEPTLIICLSTVFLKALAFDVTIISSSDSRFGRKITVPISIIFLVLAN